MGQTRMKEFNALYSSFQQELSESQKNMHNYFERLLSANVNNIALSLRQDLTHEMHLRENSFKGLKDEIEMTDRKILEEIACRRGDKYSQQAVLKDLCEKADAFQVETNNMMLRLWNAIEVHTRGVCMNDTVNTANAIHVHNERHRFQSSPSPAVSQATLARSPNISKHEVSHANPLGSTQTDLEIPVARMRSVSPNGTVQPSCLTTQATGAAASVDSLVSTRNSSYVPAFIMQPAVKTTIVGVPVTGSFPHVDRQTKTHTANEGLFARPAAFPYPVHNPWC